MIITIGREKGGGGHYAGELLAKQLGIKCYGKSLLIETPKKAAFHRNLLKPMKNKPLLVDMLHSPLVLCPANSG